MKKIILIAITVVLCLIIGIIVYILPIKEVALNKPITIKTNYTYKLNDTYFKVVSVKDVGKCPKDAECIWAGEKIYELLIIDEGINLKEISTITKRSININNLNFTIKNDKLILN